ncbi:MAG: hypothetical protein R3B57_14320 [Phycisphaerales bacterium]
MNWIHAIRLGVLLTPLLAAPAWAGPPTTFTYQGVLRESGAPVNGSRTLRFSLTTDPTGMAPVGATLTQVVDVADGLFNVSLDFADELITAYAQVEGDPQWYLLVEVREPDTSFTKLLPPQPLAAVPYATHTRGLRIDADNNAYMKRNLIVGDLNNPLLTTATAFNVNLEDGMGVQNLLAIASDLSFSVYARLRQDGGGQTGLLEFRDDDDAILARLGGMPGSATYGYLDLDATPGSLGAQLNMRSDADIPTISLSGGGGASPWASALFLGNAQGVILDLNASGDQSVQLPPASISPIETAAEPGIASFIDHDLVRASSVDPNFLSKYIATLATVGINCPAPGYVVAIASCFYFNLAFDPLSQIADFYITTPDRIAFAPGLSNRIGATANLMTVSTGPTVMIQGVFEVDAPGVLTLAFWTAGENASQGGYPSYEDRRLTLMYFPTAYGGVNAEQVVTPVAPRSAGIDTRQRAELDAYRADINTLRRRIEALETQTHSQSHRD